MLVVRMIFGLFFAFEELFLAPTWTQHCHTVTSWLHCLFLGSADCIVASRLDRTSEIPDEIWMENIQKMQGRTETVEEKRWVETTEAYGEEEI